MGGVLKRLPAGLGSTDTARTRDGVEKEREDIRFPAECSKH